MLTFIKSIGILEASLFQILFYGVLWYFNDYFALLLSAILVTILFAVLVISLISEWIEPTRVPKAYFRILGVSMIIPIVVAVFFVSVLGLTPF